MTRKEKQEMLNQFQFIMNKANNLCLDHGIDDPSKATAESLEGVYNDDNFNSIAKEFLEKFADLVRNDVEFEFSMSKNGSFRFALADTLTSAFPKDKFYMVENILLSDSMIESVLLLGTTLNTPKTYTDGIATYTTDKLYGFKRPGFKYDPRHIIWVPTYSPNAKGDGYTPDPNGHFLPEIKDMLEEGVIEPIMVSDGDDIKQLSVNVTTDFEIEKCVQSLLTSYNSHLTIRAYDENGVSRLYGAIEDRNIRTGISKPFVTFIGYKNQYEVRELE